VGAGLGRRAAAVELGVKVYGGCDEVEMRLDVLRDVVLLATWFRETMSWVKGVDECVEDYSPIRDEPVSCL
jgi:hypothetical protein